MESSSDLDLDGGSHSEDRSDINAVAPSGKLLGADPRKRRIRFAVDNFNSACCAAQLFLGSCSHSEKTSFGFRYVWKDLQGRLFPIRSWIGLTWGQLAGTLSICIWPNRSCRSLSNELLRAGDTIRPRSEDTAPRAHSQAGDGLLKPKRGLHGILRTTRLDPG